MLSSCSYVLQIPCCSVPILLFVPWVCRCWVPELGHGDGVFILFCLNELVCGRLGNRGLCILETSTRGIYPWRSECQATLCWLKKKKKCKDQCCMTCAPLSPLQIPRVFCVGLSAALRTGFTVSKCGFFPCFAATTEVQACLGSSSGAHVAP